MTCPQTGLGLGLRADGRDRHGVQLPPGSGRPTRQPAAGCGPWRAPPLRKRREPRPIWSRFERATGEWRLELEHGRSAAADPGKRQAAGTGGGRGAGAALGRPRVHQAGRCRRGRVRGRWSGPILAETRGGESPASCGARAPWSQRARAPGDPGASRRGNRIQPEAEASDTLPTSRGPPEGQGNEAGQAALTRQTHRLRRPTRSRSAPPPRSPRRVATPAPPAPARQRSRSRAPTDPKPRPGPVSSLPPPVDGLALPRWLRKRG